MRPLFFLALVASTFLFACEDDTPKPTGGTAGTAGSAGSSGSGGSGGSQQIAPIEGTSVKLSFKADLTKPEHFFDHPYPTDLRLSETGTPDLRGYPNPANTDKVAGLIEIAQQRKGFPIVPAAYFQFDAEMPELDIEATIKADKDSMILLVDVDPNSNEQGKLFPVVATVPIEDGYLPPNVLSVAPRPGFALYPKRQYAFVVMRGLKDAAGKELGSPLEFEQLKANVAPDGDLGQKAVDLYSPLWATLEKIKIDKANVAAATVFTTGDVVEETATITDKVLSKYSITIDNLEYVADGGPRPADGEQRYCQIKATVTYPQFQQGTPPFNTEGLFELDDAGMPIKQRDEVAPITLTLPFGEMPADGYPLVLYFHGSGGLSTAVVDRGRWRPTDSDADCPVMPEGVELEIRDEWEGQLGCNIKGMGPAYVVAEHGFAAAGSALPVNPERLPGASETAYLNLNNPKSFRDIFRQGLIEQRLFIKALSKLEIPAELVADCTGVSLPAGATSYKYDVSKLIAQGQSMGGMYTNLMGAVEPQIKAAVPTGAGGLWSYFVVKTPLLGGIAIPIASVVGADRNAFTFIHPALALLQTAWEPTDPLVYTPRLGLRPLPGHPARPIYEPGAKGDSYFPTVIYDAMVLAYGNRQAGEEVWTTMQDALALDGRDGLLSYPINDNLTSSNGDKYTGVMVQYEGDGVYDPHAIYSQLDEVKYQYGCFMKTFRDNGTGLVVEPAPLGTPCPSP